MQSTITEQSIEKEIMKQSSDLGGERGPGFVPLAAEKMVGSGREDGGAWAGSGRRQLRLSGTAVPGRVGDGCGSGVSGKAGARASRGRCGSAERPANRAIGALGLR